MKCQDCFHWVAPRTVESLPDYPIGYCKIFQKDVAGEYAGCAGQFFLPRDKKEWHGEIHKKRSKADQAIEIPDGAKIISISDPAPTDNMITIVYLIPENI
jgi:hypothetical protein